MNAIQHHLHFQELDSTNTYLKERGGELPDQTVVTACRQTGGRGRLGRRWLDEGDSALKCSVLFHRLTPWQMELLPAAAALAVCCALEELCPSSQQPPGGWEGLAPPSFGIKWPNDVVGGGKKLCGILCESRLIPGGSFAVCGMGLNLSQDQRFFDRAGLPHATSLLLLTGKVFLPQQVLPPLLSQLRHWVGLLREQGFAPLEPGYRQHSVTLGRQVRLEGVTGGESRLATAVDLEEGRLVCRLADGTLTQVSAGEVSVRGIYGYL